MGKGKSVQNTCHYHRAKSMCQSEISEHRKFLLAICKDLTNNEVEEMKFLCHEHIPLAKLGTACSALALVKLLHHAGIVEEGKIDFLQELLVHIGRIDLARKADDFRRGTFAPAVDCLIHGPLEAVVDSNTFSQEEKRAGNHRAKMVRDLDADIFEQLGFYLNPKSMRNWVSLAGRLGYTHTQAMNYKLEPTQSTQLLLHDWSSRPDSTVKKLHHTLQVLLRRPDAAAVLEPYLGGPGKETLIL